MRMRTTISDEHSIVTMFLNEQVAYKRGVAGPKKMATGINYCQNGRLAKAWVTDTGS